MLRLPTMRNRVTELAAIAEKEQLSYRGFLAELLMAKCEDRDRRRSERRIKGAGFPREKWLADFDFDADPAINPATINTLAGCGWIRSGEPLCLIGELRHRQVAPAHRLGLRRRDGRVPGPLRPRGETGQRACRGRRREGPQ
jgi:hypothetical protein